MNIYKNILVSQIALPATITATRTSSSVDMKGFNSLSVVFALGQSGDTLSGSVYWTLKLTHSDDDSSFSDVAASDLLSGSASIVVDSASLDEAVYHFAYKGDKRFLRAVATATGTHSIGTPMAVIALQGQPAYAPAE